MSDLFFRSKGFKSSGFVNFTPKEAYAETQSGAIFIDVREKNMSGFKRFDMPQVMYLPFSQLKERFSELPEGKWLIFADTSGLKSREAVLFLQSQGFRNIANLAGGLVEWERDEMPLKTNIDERLDGSCMCQLKRRNKSNNK